MNRDRTSSSHDPTREPTAEQSTQTASGLSNEARRPGAERERAREDAGDDLVDPESADKRRASERTERDTDPVMPDDDSTLGTKI